MYMYGYASVLMCIHVWLSIYASVYEVYLHICVIVSGESTQNVFECCEHDVNVWHSTISHVMDRNRAWFHATKQTRLVINFE